MHSRSDSDRSARLGADARGRLPGRRRQAPGLIPPALPSPLRLARRGHTATVTTRPLSGSRPGRARSIITGRAGRFRADRRRRESGGEIRRSTSTPASGIGCQTVRCSVRRYQAEALLADRHDLKDMGVASLAIARTCRRSRLFAGRDRYDDLLSSGLPRPLGGGSGASSPVMFADRAADRAVGRAGHPKHAASRHARTRTPSPERSRGSTARSRSTSVMGVLADFWLAAGR